MTRWPMKWAGPPRWFSVRCHLLEQRLGRPLRTWFFAEVGRRPFRGDLRFQVGESDRFRDVNSYRLEDDRASSASMVVTANGDY